MAELSRKPVAARHPAALERLRYGGIHIQENRDRRRGPGPRRWRAMLRLKLPLGRLSAGQYLALDELATRLQSAPPRLTAGRNIELHGIRLADIDKALDCLRERGLAIGADRRGFEFNVASPPRMRDNPRHRLAEWLAGEICHRLYPAPGRVPGAGLLACLNDPNAGAELPPHPPRKLTVGIALPEDNGADIFNQDLGLLLDRDGSDGDWRVHACVGGGASLYRGHDDSFAVLATPLGSVPAASAPDLVDAVVALARQGLALDHPRRCRLKYLLGERGRAWLLKRLRAEVPLRTAAPGPLRRLAVPPPEPDSDTLIVPVPGGRPADPALRAAIREAISELRPRLRVLPRQNLLLEGLDPAGVERARRIFAAYARSPDGNGPHPGDPVACTGAPFCRRALGEAERAASELSRAIQAVLAEFGRGDTEVDLRLAACPIGCVRPYGAEIGVACVRRDRYDVFVGGDSNLPTLGERYASQVALADVAPALRPLIALWAKTAEDGETLGAFYRRRFHGNRARCGLSGSFPAPDLPAVMHAVRQHLPTSRPAD